MANFVRYESPAVPGVLTGTAGNNLYQGSAGFDTAQIDAGRRGATIVDGPNGPVTVTSAAGTDTFNSVETLLFIDGREVYNLNDPAAQVMRVYDIVLGRTADQSGLNTFVQVLDTSTRIEDVARSLINSNEFIAAHGANLSNTQFVNVLYQNMRGVSGSVGETAGWVTQLDGGQMNRADVAAYFANSAEQQSATASVLAQGIWDRDESAISIANLYDAAFDRLPDAGGLAGWVTQAHRANVGMDAIANSFLNSNEAASLRALDDAGFINEIYQNALGRNAEAGGLASWLGQLAAGETRADVMLAISDSAEHQQITANLFQSDNPLNYGVSLIG
jgi:hypothetical protein